MSDSFDPYYIWLGIPPVEQPPHYYRLLGISLFESEPLVIESAADRQMAHIQTFRSGQHVEASQRLLNELSLAKVTLLHPQRRAEYDAGLQRQLMAQSAPPQTALVPTALPAIPAVVAEPVPFAHPAPGGQTSSPPIVSAVPVGAAPYSRLATGPLRNTRATHPNWIWIGSAAACGVLLIAAVLCALSSGSAEPRPPLASPDASGETADSTSGERFFAEAGPRPRLIPTDPSSTPTPPATPRSPDVLELPRAEAGITPPAANSPETGVVAADSAAGTSEEFAPPPPKTATSAPMPADRSPPVSDDPPNPAPAPAPADSPATALPASATSASVTPDSTEPSATTALPSGATADSAASAAHAQPWVDLLEDVETLDWKRLGYDLNERLASPPQRSGIRIKPTRFNAYPLPGVIDGDYDLELEFTRHSGRHVIMVAFPIGIHNVRLHLSSYGGTIGGVGYLDGKPYAETPTARRPCPISNGVRHRIAIQVKQDGDQAVFKIDLDGAEYASWSGPQHGLTDLTNEWPMTMIRHVWVGAWECDATFHSARIRMLSGAVQRDGVTDEDRARDLEQGLLRLVGEPANVPRVGWGKFLINQIDWSGNVERRWPLIRSEFAVCRDFYGVHAPSKLTVSIPSWAKSFSAIGYCDASRTVKFQAYIDGNLIAESGVVALAPLKFDIPDRSTVLELVVDDVGNGDYDASYWCYPRFHSTASADVDDKALVKPTPRKLSVTANKVGFGTLTYNQPTNRTKSVPVHFEDATPCEEFISACAPSSVSYAVPEGMTRFSAIGYNVMSHHVKFQVLADGRPIYESEQAGIIPINVKLPARTKSLELKIDDMGDSNWDQSFWCYPRLHKR